MAALQGYETQSQQTAQATPTEPFSTAASTATTDVANRSLATVTARLAKFSENATAMQTANAVDKAKQDAAQASINGEPFHKESVYSAYGRAYNSVASATYASQADMDINKKSSELAMEFENEPEMYDNALGEYINTMSTEAPTPALSSVIGISGAKTKNSQYGRLKIAESGRIKQGQVETFAEEWDLNTNQVIELKATGADYEVLRQKSLEHLGAMISEGLITGEEAQKLVKDAEYKVTYGVDTREMESLVGDALSSGDFSKASKFLTDKTEVNRKDMDVVENDKYRNDLNKLYNNGLKALKASQTSNKAQSNLDVKNAADVYANNQQPDDATTEAAIAGFGNSTPANQQKLLYSKKAYETLQSQGTKSLSELETFTREMKANKNASKEDLVVVGLMEKILSKRRSKANSDPQSLSVEEGRTLATNPMDANSGIDSIFIGLDARKNTAVGNIEEYGQGHGQLLTKDEAKSWSDYMNSPDVSTNEKLDFVTQLYALDEKAAETMFKQISKENAPDFAFAATMVTSGNYNAGLLAMRGKNADIVLEEGFKKEASISLGNAFSIQGGEARNAYLNGVLNYAKGYQMEQGDITFDEAIKKTVGTVKDYNGQDVLIPPSVDTSDFNKWMDNIVIAGHPVTQELVRDMPDTFFDGTTQLRTVSPGKYNVYIDNGNGVYSAQVDKTTGKPLVIIYGE